MLIMLIYLLGSVRTIKKNTEALVVASNDNDLKEHAENTKFMIISREHHAGKITISRYVINPLKMWSNSDIWEQS